MAALIPITSTKPEFEQTPLSLQVVYDPVAKRKVQSGDITLHKTDYKNARVIFRILNQKSVDRFLNNKALQDFLTAPYDGDLTKRGPRLTIASGEATIQPLDGNPYTIPTLIIGRQIGGSTIIEAACSDLFYSLFTFIIPIANNSLAEAADTLGGLRISSRSEMLSTLRELKDNPHQSVSKWVRARPFVLNHNALEEEENARMALDNKLNSFLPAFNGVPQICDHIAGYLDLPRKPVIDSTVRPK